MARPERHAPLTGEPVPIFAANFVLMGYGTGAVMAVPAHDQRDWEFAERYGIPKKQVIVAPTAALRHRARRLCREGRADRLRPLRRADLRAGLRRHRRWLAERGKGEKHVNFRLRDWGVSRQRYWGCPIPVVTPPDGGEIRSRRDRLPVAAARGRGRRRRPARR
jgi:leucyl-tRNA synthetase